MLTAEARFDVAGWRRRLQAFLKTDSAEATADQNDLFD
jgi:hypothetical protein